MTPQFKPQLLPNNKAGEAPNWEERIEHPEDWLYSNKLDGGRVEIFANGTVKGRSLKDIPSAHIQRMAEDVMLSIPLISENSIIEAEFYSHEMNFAEIMHFFRCKDVTTTREKMKYQKLWDKTGGVTKAWPFPGRTVEWLTTWHSSLKFYAFDVINVYDQEETKMQRNLALAKYTQQHIHNYGGHSPDMLMIPQQSTFTHVDQVYQMYDQAIMDDYEGIVAFHKDSTYKFGRQTLNAKQAFKIKNDNLEFDGQIIDVLGGTVAREGAVKTVNELGRSVTSKLQEDRVPSGLCKGFLVKMDDGNTLTVSLKNYDHPERRELLQNPDEWIGLWIKFTGMAPVKDGGCPRHAHYTKGNVRDEK